MKKILTAATAALLVTNSTFAGDYLANTNYSVSFLRNPSQGAKTDIASAFSNPAGMALLSKDGFHISLNGMSAYQTRRIDATTGFWTLDGQETTQTFEGKASAPFIPSIFAAYKKDNWAISGGFAVTGGGGKASFSNGLPMFNALVIGGIYQSTSDKTYLGYNEVLNKKLFPLRPSSYDINTSLDGHQYIYGGQLGFSYKFNDWFSAYVGGRMNYVSAGYKGFIKVNSKLPAVPALQPISDKLNNTGVELDVEQTGWGLTPIIGADFKFNRLNIGLKYEFVTKMNIENKTQTFNVGPYEAQMAAYKDGVNTPNDLPGMLSVAGEYQILPTLRIGAEWHLFNDKGAGMAEDKQQSLKHNTLEYIAGIEWDVNKYLTLSGGYQNTNYGVSDEFQRDTNFYCDSYSVGLGARIHLNQSLNLDLGYFWTNYSDYTVQYSKYKNAAPVSGKDVYSRTNKVFGLGVNYSF